MSNSVTDNRWKDITNVTKSQVTTPQTGASVKKTALALWGGARKKGDNGAFKYAMDNVQKSYGSFYKKSNQFVSTGKFIAQHLNKQELNSIGRLDILMHGSGTALYSVRHKVTKASGLRETIDEEFVESNNLYTSVNAYKYESWFNGPEQTLVSAIDFNVFTNDAVIEIHGCKAAVNMYTAATMLSDNLAVNLSQELYNVDKKKAVVIAHLTEANPQINGETIYKIVNGKKKYVSGTKEIEQDYRHGKRIVYHNGEILFYTIEKRHIGKKDIEKFMNKRIRAEIQGKLYDGNIQEFKR